MQLFCARERFPTSTCLPRWLMFWSQACGTCGCGNPQFEMLSMPIVHRFRNCVIWGAGCLCSPTFQFVCQGFRAALMASPRISLRSLPVIQAKADVLPKRSSSSTRCALCIETGTKRLGTTGKWWSYIRMAGVGAWLEPWKLGKNSLQKWCDL